MECSLQNLDKLLDRLQRMVEVLSQLRNNFTVHQQIDQFYYMVKIIQLKYLKKNYEEAAHSRQKITEWIDEESHEVYHRWRKEVRWLNQYILRTSPLECSVYLSGK